ncbi:hypothetical protein M0R45_005657 [Rubus argutus]|uniref:RRM domain-containing protein n=1 Tax=Rubus argutus TaxID=59490 RepID=A0AAW1YNV8_RUBAR
MLLWKSSNDHEEEQLEQEFKKFGSVKRDRIQVIRNKQRCFGFVEFESATSMQSAIEASPITIGDHQAVIEEKRSTTQVSNRGSGSFSFGRAAFLNDSFTGHGNYGGSRRNEFRNHVEFS